MEKLYDVLIAGGGLSGVLTAFQLSEAHKEWTVGIIDKEARLGGRLVSLNPEFGSWGYGLNRMSDQLYAYFNEQFKEYPEAEDIFAGQARQESRIGVLSAGQLTETNSENIFTATGGARAIGGAAAERDWSKVEALMESCSNEKKQDLPISQVYSGTRKSPSAIVLQHLARLWGIADLWTVSPSTLKAKVEEFQGSKTCGYWEQALEASTARQHVNGRLDFHLSTRITEAQFEDNVWRLKTTTGIVTGKRLVVAQSPWEASLWLPRLYWPSKLLSLINRVRPSSAVVLVVKRQASDHSNLPDRIVIPAENIQVLVDPHSICFQATIPYEFTLQAPEVVKAIKRLRRARKKLVSAYDSLEIEGEHIALQPVGWAAPLSASERRLMNKFKLNDCQSETLAFCGDMYGASVKGDENIMESTQSVVSTLR